MKSKFFRSLPKLAAVLAAVFCLILTPLRQGEAAAQSASGGAVAGGNLVKLETNLGNIYIELDFDKAPVSSANFKQYVESGFYNGTIFHRVISDFMIQGGGYTPDMQEKGPLRAPIINEADNGLKNVTYSVAMARTGYPHSATVQFFINVKTNKFLDYKAKTTQGWGYAVFGKVVNGQDVVEKIRISPTKSGGLPGETSLPTIPIVIRSAKMVHSVMD
jgi:peptidyl-prolyl cis-trans isomerase B (cyclophilin B)